MWPMEMSEDDAFAENEVMLDLCSSSEPNCHESDYEDTTSLRDILDYYPYPNIMALENTAFCFMERVYDSWIRHEQIFDIDHSKDYYEDKERFVILPTLISVQISMNMVLSFVFGGYDTSRRQENSKIYVSVNCAACGRCGEPDCLKCLPCRCAQGDCRCRKKNTYALLSRNWDKRGTYIDITELCEGSFGSQFAIGVVGMSAMHVPGIKQNKIYLSGGLTNGHISSHIYEFDMRTYKIRRSSVNPYVGGYLLYFKATGAIKNGRDWDYLLNGYLFLRMTDTPREDIDNYSIFITMLAQQFVDPASMVNIALCDGKKFNKSVLCMQTISDGFTRNSPLLWNRWETLKEDTPIKPLWKCQECGQYNRKKTREYCGTCGRLKYVILKKSRS